MAYSMSTTHRATAKRHRIKAKTMVLSLGLLLSSQACFKSKTDSIPEIGLIEKIIQAEKKPVTEIILYATSTTYDGALGGRSGADSKCSADRATQVASASTCTTVHALISIASGDAIANMASNYSVPTSLPIKSATGVLIFNNWNDLLTSNPIVSLNSATSTGTYWTFSGANGVLDATNNCTNGSTNLSGNGEVGDQTSTAGGFWLVNAALSCGGSRQLLCICY